MTSWTWWTVDIMDMVDIIDMVDIKNLVDMDMMTIIDNGHRHY